MNITYTVTIHYTENSEQPSLYMAPLQDGRSADNTSDPKKTGGEGNKAIKLLKMLESKKQKNVVGRLVAKKK